MKRGFRTRTLALGFMFLASFRSSTFAAEPPYTWTIISPKPAANGGVNCADNINFKVQVCWNPPAPAPNPTQTSVEVEDDGDLTENPTVTYGGQAGSNCINLFFSVTLDCGNGNYNIDISIPTGTNTYTSTTITIN